MSEIAGMLDLDGSPVDPELLHAMTRYLTLRGPDTQRNWCEGPVGFGHTLLRTAPETKCDEQPAILDGKFWITADARIDDRANLIEKLHSKSSSASSADPDHQLILHTYRVWGADQPYYLKVDIEGSDTICLRALVNFEQKTDYVSIESENVIFAKSLEEFHLYRKLGYTVFKAVRHGGI